MHSYSILLLLSLCLVIPGCNSNSNHLIGKWNREVKSTVEQELEGTGSNWGDITLNSDSTFFIFGGQE
jgi:hypothetical protein